MRFKGALCAATILAAPVIASAQPVSGVYVGLGAGFNYQEDQGIGSITVPGPVLPGRPLTANTSSLNVNYGTGYVLLGSIGYGLGNGLRFEAEGRYSDNGVNKITGTPNPNSSSGRSQIYGVMANALYDFDLSSWGIGGFYPYVGVGAGYGWQNVALDFRSSPNPFNYYGNVNGTEGDFAAQAIAGFGVPIAAVPGLSLTVEYRYYALIGNHSYNGYVETPGATAATTRVTPTRFSLNTVGNQEGIVGLRYAFNVAPPPPPPPPPPVVVPPTRSYLVFFDWDKATLTARATQIIREAADASTHVQYTRIEVDGYTDTSGTPRYNQGLSVRRAEAVAAELVHDGVPRNAISIQGFGETHLLVPTGPGVREPQNRRVEIIIK
jgi:OmpA-OmpF porin, OOP family